MCAHIGQNRDIYPPSINPLYFRLVYPLPLFRRFIVGAAIEKNFFIFSRYNSILFFFKLSTFRLAVIFYLCVILVWFPVEFNYLVYITISGFDYNFGFCVFRLIFTRWILLASISTCFSIVYYTLCLFNSLSLLLVINKHLCLCKVWFMLILAILRLSDVFLFVLGVVYRLGIK